MHPGSARNRPRAALVVAAATLALATSDGAAAIQGEVRLAPSQLVVLRETTRVVETVGDEVWEGWGRSPRPTLVIGESHEFLVGLPPRSTPPDRFQPLEQSFHGRPVLRRPRTLPATLRTAFPLNGTPTAVVGAWRADVETPNEWAMTLGRAWFQVFQMQHGEQRKFAELQLGPEELPSWQLEDDFPYGDPDVGNAMRLLGQSLYEFWANGARLPRASQRAFAAESAWAALQNLRAIVTLKHGERAWRYFQFTAWKDGVARYTAVRLAREVAQAEVLEEFEHAPGFGTLEGGRSYTRMWEETVRSHYWLIRTSGRAGERDRTALLALGHGIAELLDAIHPEWKDRYFEPGVWLDDLVAEAMTSRAPDS